MFKLPDLPYSYESLTPYMSSETLEYHHDKHHKAYIDFVNKFISDNNTFSESTLEEIIVASSKDKSLTPLFNNASQAFNHTEFWSMMSKSSSNNATIPPKLLKKINEDFDSLEKFKSIFISKGTSLFGSGWVWLTLIEGKLSIVQHSGGSNPLKDGLPVILGCDVWEHAYYIDYRNKRADYLNAFLDHMVNWEYVDNKLTQAL